MTNSQVVLHVSEELGCEGRTQMLEQIGRVQTERIYFLQDIRVTREKSWLRKWVQLGEGLVGGVEEECNCRCLVIWFLNLACLELITEIWYNLKMKDIDERNKSSGPSGNTTVRVKHPGWETICWIILSVIYVGLPQEAPSMLASLLHKMTWYKFLSK